LIYFFVIDKLSTQNIESEMISLKLNKECIRDLLLFVENLDTPSASEDELIEFGKDKGYPKKELIYTIQKLEEAKFIDASISYGGGRVAEFRINSITYEGHQFIDTIRDNAIWREAKKKASALKDVSLPIMSQIAISLAKQQLGL